MAWKTDEICEGILDEIIEARRPPLATGCKWHWKRPQSDEEPWKVPVSLDRSTGLLTLSWRHSEDV